jgi:hypothetical protein
VALANGDNKLGAGIGPNGSKLNLATDAGKGSIGTGPGGVKIQGQNGTLNIPTAIPGMPTK